MPPTRTPALKRLRPEERGTILDALLRAHPDLRDEAERMAVARLDHTTAEGVAAHVEAALAMLDLDDLAARCGRVRGGYVHETDAASELVDDALEPIEADLQRCIALDRHDAARATLQGIVVGLYRCTDPPDGTVLAYAGPDTPIEHASWIVDQAAKSSVELDADELEQACPGWMLTPNGLRPC